MWATARYDLRMTDAEFWHSTPAKYFAIHDRWALELEHRDFMLAQICSVVANSFRGKKGKPIKTADFMPWKRKDRGKQKKRQTVAEQIAIAKAITIAYGGLVIDKSKSVR